MKKNIRRHIKQYIKRYWWIALIALIFLIPRVIDYLYFRGLKLSAPNTFLSAGDLLTYIGSAGAIVGVIFTIRAEQKKYHDDVLKRVMPSIISANSNQYLTKTSLVEACKEEAEKEPDIYLYINSDGYDFFHNITDARQYKSGFHNGTEGLKSRRYYTKEYVNVGVGAAVNIEFSICEKCSEILKPGPITISLLPGQGFKMGMFVETKNNEAGKMVFYKYDIIFKYSNIYGNIIQDIYSISFSNNVCLEDHFREEQK